MCRPVDMSNLIPSPYLSLSENVDDVEELPAGHELCEDEDVRAALEGGHHLHHERAAAPHVVQDTELCE